MADRGLKEANKAPEKATRPTPEELLQIQDGLSGPDHAVPPQSEVSLLQEQARTSQEDLDQAFVLRVGHSDTDLQTEAPNEPKSG